MDFEDIEYDVADGIATIALNRPDKLNAGTPRMIRELLTAIDLIDADDDVRAVIFTGRGRAFCAGADLSSGGSTFDYDRQRREGGEDLSNVDPEVAELRLRDGAGLVTLRLFDCTKPVISAINGPAVGMGVTMTLATDIRMASETARFGFVFTQRGIVPEGASSWFLPRVVGLSQALEWVYTGRVFDAAEALRGGLVRSVHAPDELLDAARALAAEIAAGAPISVALDPENALAHARCRPSHGGPPCRLAARFVPPGSFPMPSRASRPSSRSARRRSPARSPTTCPTSSPTGTTPLSAEKPTYRSLAREPDVVRLCCQRTISQRRVRWG